MQERARSGKSIAVMSSKGGVGKSTISLALAETISYSTPSRVLIIDADPQGSISSMMEIGGRRSHSHRATLSSLLSVLLEPNQNGSVETLASQILGMRGSDVDGAEGMDILPVGSSLIRLERRITRESRDADLVRAIGDLLCALKQLYDVILVDCAPGLYLSTESWLQTCDFQLAPIKADNISLSALDLVFDFRRENTSGVLSKWLGIVINGYQGNQMEQSVLRMISTFDDLRLFKTIIPATLALQRLSLSYSDYRSFNAKYPGNTGSSLREFSKELFNRLEQRSVMA